MEERNKDIVIDGQQETLLFQDVCTIIEHGRQQAYGRSYSKRNLDYYKKFYLLFPEPEKVNTRVHNLEWTHVRRVLSVTNPEARLWYLTSAA